MNDLQKNLLDWAEKTVKVYVDYANTHDDAPAFYTQSPLNGITQSPELLIMGINPGSSGTYKDQKDKSKNWHFKGEDMSAEELLSGNFCKIGKDSNVSQWEFLNKSRYWQNLNSYFKGMGENNPLRQPENFVLTNATFFATLKAAGLEIDIIPQTIQCTIELISIIQPKKIIVLSGCKTINQIKRYLQKIETNNTIIEVDYPNYVPTGSNKHCCRGKFICEQSKIDFLGVPHPSAHFDFAPGERGVIANEVLKFMSC